MEYIYFCRISCNTIGFIVSSVDMQRMSPTSIIFRDDSLKNIVEEKYTVSTKAYEYSLPNKILK